jgi:DNA-binding IclR family transcriptional regulator
MTQDETPRNDENVRAAANARRGSPPLAQSVQAVDRAVMLLRELAGAGRPLRLAELASRCELKRPTAWRLLATLERHGLVERQPSGNAYGIASGALPYLRPPLVDSLARRARPVLRRIAQASGVTASLAYVDRFAIVYIDQIDSSCFTSPNWVDAEIALHASSPGKAVMAALPAAEWRGMLPPTLDRLTDTTITDVDHLAAELEATRRRGYATCEGEDVTFSNGVSAVVVDAFERPIAAVNLWGADRLVPTSRFAELGLAAMTAAAEISSSMSGGVGSAGLLCDPGALTRSRKPRASSGTRSLDLAEREPERSRDDLDDDVSLPAWRS